MKFFIDSADVDEIKEAISWGIVDGITTNPSLIKKAALKHNVKNLNEYIIKLLSIAGKLPVSLEVISMDHESMYSEGKKLYEMFKDYGNVVIKVPVNTSEDNDGEHFDGIKTIKKLADDGIAINVTLVMTPEQALIAAKAGAKYVSPFVGRIDDHIRKKHGIDFDKSDYYDFNEECHDCGVYSGAHLVGNIKEIFDNYDFDCEIIAASLRNPRQIRECAIIGSHIGTIPFSVLKKILTHTKTMEGITAFKNDVVPEYKKLFE